MNNRIVFLLKRFGILLLALVVGFWIGCIIVATSMFAYEHGLKRPIWSKYVNKGFGRNSVRFVLAYVSSNDVGTCRYILFHRTGRDRIETHKQAVFASIARANRGDPILVPLVCEYAQDSSWDNKIRNTAINLLIREGGTQGVAVVREIALRTNDPMAEVASELLKIFPQMNQGDVSGNN